MMKYNGKLRMMHWIMSVAIISLLFIGLWMKSLPNDFDGKYDIYDMHKSFGLLVMLLVIARVFLRLLFNAPSLNDLISKRDAIISAIVVILLYICMFMMPISGYLMSSLAGYNVMFFGWTTPSFLQQNHDYSSFFACVHEIGGYIMIACVALHIAGFLKHLIIDKINLLKRMW